MWSVAGACGDHGEHVVLVHHPEVARCILLHIPDGERALSSIRSCAVHASEAAGAWIVAVEAVVLGSCPKAAIAVLQQRGNVVAADAGAVPFHVFVHAHRMAITAYQTVLRAEPHVPRAILEDGTHHALWQAVIHRCPFRRQRGERNTVLSGREEPGKAESGSEQGGEHGAQA